MKSKFNCLCVLICLCFFHLHGTIIEITHFDEMQEYLQPDSLILLDIDNTLMEPVQILGSDQWFRYRMDAYTSLGTSKTEALENALAEWEAVQFLTKVQVVEEGTQQFIKTLQEKYKVIGFTTRGLALATRTVFQLKSIGIDLTPASLTQEEIYFQNGHGIIFRGGILFTSGTHKGSAFGKFLDILRYTPTSVVFINDKASDLAQVEGYCQQHHIPFIGLRYGYLDEKVKSFRADIADVQFDKFKHILTDHEAANFLKSAAKISAMEPVYGNLAGHRQ